MRLSSLQSQHQKAVDFYYQFLPFSNPWIKDDHCVREERQNIFNLVLHFKLRGGKLIQWTCFDKSATNISLNFFSKPKFAPNYMKLYCIQQSLQFRVTRNVNTDVCCDFMEAIGEQMGMSATPSPPYIPPPRSLQKLGRTLFLFAFNIKFFVLKSFISLYFISSLLSLPQSIYWDTIWLLFY